MLIRVWLNGRTPAVFLVDTGFNANCLTDTLAKKLEIPSRPAIGSDGQPLRFGGKASQAVTVASLQMGTFRLVNSSYLVINGKGLSALLGQSVEGVIGAATLRIYPALFDFQQHQITLFSPSPLTADELKSVGMDNAAIVPVTDNKDNWLFICRVQLRNGSKTAEDTLLVDTGGSGTLLSAVTVHQLGLQPFAEDGIYQTYFGQVAINTSVVSKLSLGQINIDNVPVIYPQRLLPPDYSPHLGLNLLSRYKVLLDYGQKKMYLKPLAAFAPLIQIKPSPPEGVDDRTPAGQGK